MNQDPEIPNIDAGDYSARKSATDMFMPQSLPTAPDGKQHGLTLAHVKQLNTEQRHAAEEIRRKSDKSGSRAQGSGGPSQGGPGPSTSRSPRSYRAPPNDVELGAKRDAYMIESSSDEGQGRAANKPRPPRPPPRSRGSYRSRRSLDDADAMPIDTVLESATGSSTTHSQVDIDFDYSAERDRVRQFFEQNGYMPAPRQAPDAARRRLRVIRRLGLEKPDKRHRTVLDRFTRLATSIFKTPRAVVSVIGRDKQIFLSQIGFGNARSANFDESFCCHTVIAGPDQCVAIPDATKDWRFQRNPNVGAGVIRFYAGAPLCVGKGPKAAVIGSMCIIDDAPRNDFGDAEMRLLRDLAECAVSEVSDCDGRAECRWSCYTTKRQYKSLQSCIKVGGTHDVALTISISRLFAPVSEAPAR